MFTSRSTVAAALAAADVADLIAARPGLRQVVEVADRARERERRRRERPESQSARGR